MKIWQAAVLTMGIGVAGAQTPPAPTFDVAVIHQAALPNEASIRGGQFRMGTQIRGDSADFNFVTLAELIPYAYRVKDFQVVGPSYLREARWNIQVRFSGSADGVPEMMQALLSDRFKMTIHREKREQPVYELVVAKGGPKMELAEGGDAVASPATPGLPGLFGGFGGPPPEGGPGRGPDGAGPQSGGRGNFTGGRGVTLMGVGGSTRISPSPENCGLQLEFDRLSMPQLAETLTPFLDRPVLDSTELKGGYKAALKLPIEAMLSMFQNQMRGSGFEALAGGRGGFPGGRGGGDLGGRGGPAGGAGPLGGCDIAGALASGDTNASNAIFQAVQQLGLRLQPKKAPFDTIIVDRVEKQPTEN